MLSLFISFLLSIHVIVSLLIIFIVLMQRPKSEGLGAAFGGGMTENLFGAQTSNVLANFTRWLGGIFFVLTLILSILYAKQSTQHSAIQAAALKAAAAAAAESSASPASDAAALTGTAAFSGTANLPGAPAPAASPSGPVDMKLGAPGASPANALMPAPTLHNTPAPASTPVSSGTYSGH
jgi:preprotein translocase subunit SecG